MPTFLQDNKMLAWVLAAIAFGVAIILVLKIVEIAVDLRRRLPSGARSRQLRLGFVETFDLDGERQLLLVRRDNVEHLLLIGGPNDVLVESGIVRVEPRESRGPRAADASATSIPVQAPTQVPPPAPSPLPEVAAAIETALAAPEVEHAFSPEPTLPPAPAFNPAPAFVPEPFPRPAPAPGPEWGPPPVPDAAAPEPEPPAPVSPPERRAPRFPLPPRSGPASASAFAPTKPLGPPPRFTPPNFSPAGQKGENPAPRPRFVMPPIARRSNLVAPPPIVSAPIAPPPVAPAPVESFHTPPPVAPDPPTPVVETPVAPPRHELVLPPEFHPESAPRREPVAHPEPAPPPRPSPEPAFDADFEPLESLEEEMAKLLGRPLNK